MTRTWTARLLRAAWFRAEVVAHVYFTKGPWQEGGITLDDVHALQDFLGRASISHVLQRNLPALDKLPHPDRYRAPQGAYQWIKEVRQCLGDQVLIRLTVADVPVPQPPLQVADPYAIISFRAERWVVPNLLRFEASQSMGQVHVHLLAYDLRLPPYPLLSAGPVAVTLHDLTTRQDLTFTFHAVQVEINIGGQQFVYDGSGSRDRPRWR